MDPKESSDDDTIDPTGDSDLPYEEDEVNIEENEDDTFENELINITIAEFSAWIREPGRINNLLNITGRREMLSESSSMGGRDYAAELRNWEIPMVHFDETITFLHDGPPSTDSGSLALGATFLTKDDLAIAVGLWHMEHHVEYRVLRSSKRRLQYICKHNVGCPFQLRAVANEDMWRIIKFENTHTCEMDLTLNAPRQVPSKVIAAYFARKLINEGTILKPKDIMFELLSKFGIEIHYQTALHARNLAVEMIYGDYDKSFQKLPSYLYMLKQRNPSTIYDLETTNDGHFKFMFLALGVCVSAWMHCMCPVIVLDGTHLKGRYKGILFVAVTKDGNEQCFPLAVGVGPIENDESWIWFLARLRWIFGQPDNLLIVSDQHKSIKNAVAAMYPNVVHGLCYYHLHKNLARYGSHVGAMFENAAYAYRDETFQKWWSMISKASPNGAYQKLLKIGVERWSRSQCPVSRFNFMTSNTAESFNARLLWARRLPICSLLEIVRSIVEKWWDKRRALAKSRDHPLTEVAMKKISVSVNRGREMTVRNTTTNVYRVEDGKMSFLVDLDNKICECREFQFDMIPCSHATAAIRRAGGKMYDYVWYYYKQENLCKSYEGVIKSLPHPSEWIVPDEISSHICLQPPSIRQAGCSKMSRHRSWAESSTSTRRQVCSRCKGSDHNRARCTNPIASGHIDSSVSADDTHPTVNRRRQPKKCSICRDPDHTKAKCPMRVEDASD